MSVCHSVCEDAWYRPGSFCQTPHTGVAQLLGCVIAVINSLFNVMLYFIILSVIISSLLRQIAVLRRPHLVYTSWARQAARTHIRQAVQPIPLLMWEQIFWADL